MSRFGTSALDQGGYLLIELVVSAMVLLLALSALAAAMTNSDNSSISNERQIDLLSVVQNRIEDVHQVAKQYGFTAVALSSNPAQGSDATLPTAPTDPDDFISPYVSNFVTSTSGTSENYLIEKNWDNTTEGTISGSSYSEELEVDPTNGKVSPVVYVDTSTDTTYSSSSSVPSGDPYAAVYTYITIAPHGVNANLETCPVGTVSASTAGDTRRVIVAARLYQPRTGDIGSVTPQYASTVMSAPVAANQCPSSWGLNFGPDIK